MQISVSKLGWFLNFELFLIPRYTINFYQCGSGYPFHSVDAYSRKEARSKARELAIEYARQDDLRTAYQITKDGKLIEEDEVEPQDITVFVFKSKKSS